MSKAKQDEVAALEAQAQYEAERFEFVSMSAALTFASVLQGYDPDAPKEPLSAYADASVRGAELLWERLRRGPVVETVIDEPEVVPAGRMVTDALKGVDAIAGDLRDGEAFVSPARVEKPKGKK